MPRKVQGRRIARARQRAGVKPPAYRAGNREGAAKAWEILVYDSDVHLSQIFGANRRFMDQHLPHIGSLICSDLHAVIDKSQVLVVGLNDERVFEALALRTREEQYVLDLVNIGKAIRLRAHVEGLCW